MNKRRVLFATSRIHTFRQLLCLAALLAGAGICYTAEPVITDTSQPFVTPLKSDDFDAAAFSMWVDGSEKRVDVSGGPGHGIWTQNSAPEWDGIVFGSSKTPGVRHMRVALKTPVRVGSILVCGGGVVSVLKPDAKYPGNMTKEDEWIPAKRIKAGKVSGTESSREDCVVWVLPKSVTTRAVRFTHTAAPADRSYEGWLGGAYILSERVANIAEQATAVCSARTEAAHLINNGKVDGWGAWDNGQEGNDSQISSENAEWVMLVWPSSVKLRGLNALWAGFGAAEVQIYKGPADRHPREAAEQDWQVVKEYDNIDVQYPRPLGVNWMDFGQEISTRALRMRIIRAGKEGHPHLEHKTRNGKRVWLGELVALQMLGDADLAGAILPAGSEMPHPPIAIPFTLKNPGYVTLVIEKPNGERVRNLIGETWFPAGRNTAWWDGTDDLLRDTESARHGIYKIPSRLVDPGTYRVRGLVHDAIDLHYEFAVYTAGNPAWETADHTGAWLANHTPPSSVLFVPPDKAPGKIPLMFIGSYVTEGGHGLAWFDLNGRKQGGQGWIGGAWTGAPFLARDAGQQSVPDVYAYAGSAWDEDLRLTALTNGGNKTVVKYSFPGGKPEAELTGMAIHNAVMVCSLHKRKELLFVDARAGKVIGAASFEDPRGLAFDAQGRLLVLTAHQLHRYKMPEVSGTIQMPAPEILVNSGLEDPQQIALDPQGNIYVSDRGSSHQVKVFSQDGKSLRTIGKPGVPRAGQYDQLHMNNPNGVTVDSKNRLWVAETDFQPKRISVWTLDGKLVKAYYGPAEYGCGGKLDPADKTLLYYHGMTFKLDWDKGTFKLVDVFFRPGPDDLQMPDGFGCNGTPEFPIYFKNNKYFTNCHDNNPTGGSWLICLWKQANDIAVPVTAFGSTKDWKELASRCGDGLAVFSARWTGQIQPRYSEKYTFYTLSDDGIRLWVNNQLLIDNWTDHGGTENTGTIDLEAGRKYDIKIEYYQGGGGAVAKLLWSSQSQAKEIIPAGCLFAAGSAQAGGLKGEYFSGKNFDEYKISQTGPGIDFDWPGGVFPMPATDKSSTFKDRLPAGVNPVQEPVMFVWSDLNSDGKIQKEEVSFARGSAGGLTVMPDLSIVASRVGETTTRFAPVKFTDKGVPVYDLNAGQTLATGVLGPASSGGDQALVSADGWAVITLGIKPLTGFSLSGVYKGKPKWSYPSLWPGLHASHESPSHEFPGELIGTTRLLGGFITPSSDSGPVWGVNGNQGNMYLLTADGLFVATLFKDVRQGILWAMPKAERGMLLNELTLHDENFWPSITQTGDGKIYVLTNSCLVRVDGLESIRRLPTGKISISADDLKKAQAYQIEYEAQRLKNQGSGILTVAIRPEAPVIDGKIDDWKDAGWVDIDKRGVAAWFDSNTRPYNVTAAMAKAGDCLYVAYRTGDKDLLRNSGDTPNAAFKTGGALDLMLGTDPKADPNRTVPAEGDIRLLVTQVNGKTLATLYRAVVPGTKEPVPFSSPWRTITFDKVEDVSAQVRFAGTDGNFEIAVPLSVLGLDAKPGLKIKGDVGILRGNGFQTMQRVYWNNKATGITSDVPSEAELTPQLWGKLEFRFVQ